MPYFQKKNSATYVYKNLRKFGGRNPNQNWAQAQNTKHQIEEEGREEKRATTVLFGDQSNFLQF